MLSRWPGTFILNPYHRFSRKHSPLASFLQSFRCLQPNTEFCRIILVYRMNRPRWTLRCRSSWMGNSCRYNLSKWCDAEKFLEFPDWRRNDDEWEWHYRTDSQREAHRWQSRLWYKGLESYWLASYSHRCWFLGWCLVLPFWSPQEFWFLVQMSLIGTYHHQDRQWRIGLQLSSTVLPSVLCKSLELLQSILRRSFHWSRVSIA